MKIVKYVAWIVGGLVSLLLIALAILPTLVSTSFGNRLVLRLAQSTYPGTIAFESLSLSWLHGAHLSRFTINDVEGRLVASFDELHLDKPLVGFLISPTNIGNLSIVNPRACLYENTAQMILEPVEEKSCRGNPKQTTQQSSPTAINIPLSGNIALVNASVDIFNAGKIAGGIQGANLTVKANFPKKIELSVDALLASGELSTPFHAEAQGSECSHSAMEAEAKITCKTIPTQLLSLFAQNIDHNLPQILEELLGSSFSVQCSASLHNGNLACTTAIQSTHLNTDLSFKYQNNVLTIEKGHLVSATCTPTLCNLLSRYLPDKAQISLLQPAMFSIQNNMPLVIDCNSIAINDPAHIAFSSPSQIQLLIGREKQPLTLSLNSVLSHENITTRLLNDLSVASGTLNGILKTETSMEFREKALHLDSSAEISGNWTSFIEKFEIFPAATIIGPSISFKAICKGFFESKNAFSLSGQTMLSSQNLQHTFFFAIDQNKLAISAADIIATISNTLCTILNVPIQTQNPTESLQFSAKVSNCIIPIEKGDFSIPKMALDASATISIPLAKVLNGEITTKPSTSTVKLKKSSNEPVFGFVLDSVLPCSFPKIPAVQTLLGSNGLHVSAQGSLNPSNSTLSLEKATLESQAITAILSQIEAMPSPLFKVAMHKPASIAVRCSNELLHTPESKAPPVTLLAPCTLSCSVDPFEITLDKQFASKAPIQGSFSIDQLRISTCKETDCFTLQSPFSFDPSVGIATLKSLVSQNNKPLVDSATSIDFSGKSPKIHSKVTITNFPVSLLELFSQKKLADALGSSISSTIDCSFSGIAERNNTLQFTAAGDFWNIGANLVLNDMILTSKGERSLFAEATITPQRMQAIAKLCNSKTTISLTEPSKIALAIPVFTANIEHLLENNPSSIPYFKTLHTTSLQCTASLAPLKLSSKNQQFFSVESILATVKLCGDKNAVSFGICSPKSQSTTLEIKGSISDAWDESGLRLDALNVESSINISNFPTSALEITSPGKGELLTETLGPKLNCTSVIDVRKMTTGNISLDGSAKNASVHCDALVEKGILRLKNPAKATLVITQQAGELFLKNIAPFLSTAARSEKPLLVTVPPEGVAIPITPFSPATMKIPNITVDLGKLIVKNGGILRVILGVLGQGKSASSEEVPLWITPVYASIANGAIACKRADFLVADSIHMMYWGNANLNNSSLDMIVAIPDETLLSLHLVPVSFKPGNGIQIPITGSTNNPKVETTGALAKLAGAGVSSYGKDPQVQIFGALIQAAASAIDSGKPIPPPTTAPFPWEVETKRPK